MPCLPCGGPPSEIKLLARCYPQSQGLEKSETAFRPSKQELSDLVSALRDRPGQLPRVVGELEKKVQKVTGRTSGDNTHRAYVWCLVVMGGSTDMIGLYWSRSRYCGR
jgi:hypothetical protein